MSTLPDTQQVRWQDLKVRNEIEVVLEIAQREGWKDCEIFGHGDMITQPRELMGWNLIPADLYKYSIPREAVGRLHQIINAGVRIQGVIIADDERRKESTPKPTKPIVLRPPVKKILPSIGKALLRLIYVVGAIALIALFAVSIIYLVPILILGFVVGAVAGVNYDPKLVILVEDGKGGIAWVSLYTWYD